MSGGQLPGSPAREPIPLVAQQVLGVLLAAATAAALSLLISSTGLTIFGQTALGVGVFADVVGVGWLLWEIDLRHRRAYQWRNDAADIAERIAICDARWGVDQRGEWLDSNRLSDDAQRVMPPTADDLVDSATRGELMERLAELATNLVRAGAYRDADAVRAALRTRRASAREK